MLSGRLPNGWIQFRRRFRIRCRFSIPDVFSVNLAASFLRAAAHDKLLGNLPYWGYLTEEALRSWRTCSNHRDDFSGLWERVDWGNRAAVHHEIVRVTLPADNPLVDLRSSEIALRYRKPHTKIRRVGKPLLEVWSIRDPQRFYKIVSHFAMRVVLALAFVHISDSSVQFADPLDRLADLAGLVNEHYQSLDGFAWSS